MIHSIIFGALSFAFVSVLAFSVWAFGGRWFHFHGGELAMYAVIAAVFLGLSGILLQRLVKGARPMKRFYTAFLPAFFAYAILWCLAWFVVKGRTGEWLGSLAGSMAFAWVVVRCMKSRCRWGGVGLIVFIANSLGYFVGGEWMYGVLRHGIDGLTKPEVALVAKLGWGLFYGLGFGSGIGAAFHLTQRDGHSDHVTSASQPS